VSGRSGATTWLDDRLAFFASDDALLLAARLLDPHHLRFMGCGPRVARPVRNLGPALSNPHRLMHNEATWWKGPIAIEAARKLWRRRIGRLPGKPGRVPASWAGRTGGFAFGRPKNKRRPHARYSLFFTIGQTEPEHSGSSSQRPLG
jgi:hypothetical protein